jgi:hypothetical protein
MSAENISQDSWEWWQWVASVSSGVVLVSIIIALTGVIGLALFGIRKMTRNEDFQPPSLIDRGSAKNRDKN